MRRLALLLPILCAGFHCQPAAHSNARIQSRPSSGGDYPQPAATLQNWLQNKDSAEYAKKIRRHGWSLLEQLTSNPAKPDWEDHQKNWQNKCDLGLSTLCGLAPLTTDYNEGQKVGVSSMIFSVFYNKAAAKWINDNGLKDGQALLQLWQAKKNIPDPPPTAMVAKEIWEGFTLEPRQTKNLLLFVYDPDNRQLDPNYQASSKLKPISDWGATTLSLKLTANGDLDPADCSADYRADSANRHPSAVPKSCFFTKQSSGTCDAMFRFAAPPQVKGTIVSPNKPCLFFLVGLEIATREMNNWTWTTYWWTPQCKGDTAGNNCTSDGKEDFHTLPQAFRHFAMGTMLTPDTLPPVENNEKAFALANPYFEGPTSGMQSSCVLCHARAVYVADQNCLPGRDPALCPDPHRTGIGVEQLTKVPFGTETLEAHFLWSLVSNQDNFGSPTPLDYETRKKLIHFSNPR